MLGEIISKLPVDVQLGKLIVLGHIFGVLEEAVIIAAGYVFFLNGCQETSFFGGGHQNSSVPICSQETRLLVESKLLWFQNGFRDLIYEL